MAKETAETTQDNARAEGVSLLWELTGESDDDWYETPDEWAEDCEVTITRDPLESFGGYRIMRGRREGTFKGLRFIEWDSVQVRKGERREPMLVLDLGEFRACVRARAWVE